MIIIPFGYPDPLEFEADVWAYRRMSQSGRSQYESLMFLRKLEQYARRPRLSQWPGRAGTQGQVLPVENHLRAHTAAWDRLKHLKELIAKASSSTK